MKKIAYIAPQLEVCAVMHRESLMAISTLTGTNVEGLGVDTENPTDAEGLVKDLFNIEF